MMIDYIFDIDGTLWDSTEVVARAYNAAALNWQQEHHWVSARHDPITADDLKGQFGKPIAEIRDNLYGAYPMEARNQIIRETGLLQIEMLKQDPPSAFDGVEETLQYLHQKGCKLFIVSNCEKGYIPTMLECTGLGPYFTDTISHADTGLLKADNLTMLIKRHNLQNPVYVGDTLGDEIATHKIGIPFYYAAYGFGKSENPDRVLQSIRDLCD